MGLEAGGREITCFISIQEAEETGSRMRLYTLKHHLPSRARMPRDSLQANLKQRHLLGNHMFNYLSFWGTIFFFQATTEHVFLRVITFPVSFLFLPSSTSWMS